MKKSMLQRIGVVLLAGAFLVSGCTTKQPPADETVKEEPPKEEAPQQEEEEPEQEEQEEPQERHPDDRMPPGGHALFQAVGEFHDCSTTPLSSYQLMYTDWSQVGRATWRSALAMKAWTIIPEASLM